MAKVRIIDVHENVFAENDRIAEEVRTDLAKKGIFMLNVMSSPGSGKTTLLTAAISMLREEYRIGVMDVDIESSLDAQRVADLTGAASLQIHNGGLCHIDAEMTASAIRQFGTEELDLLFLENIGNLVCPAEFDTGSHKNMMILSVPEGHDKPLKYPLMFSICDLIVISKVDTKDFFSFNEDKAMEYIRELNPKAEILFLSAKTGEGMDVFCDWIRKNAEQYHEKRRNQNE